MASIARSLRKAGYLQPVAETEVVQKFLGLLEDNDSKNQLLNMVKEIGGNISNAYNPMIEAQQGPLLPSTYEQGPMLPQSKQPDRQQQRNDFIAKQLFEFATQSQGIKGVNPNDVNTNMNILKDLANNIKPPQKEPIKGTEINHQLINPYTGEKIGDYRDLAKPEKYKTYKFDDKLVDEKGRTIYQDNSAIDKDINKLNELKSEALSNLEIVRSIRKSYANPTKEGGYTFVDPKDKKLYEFINQDEFTQFKETYKQQNAKPILNLVSKRGLEPVIEYVKKNMAKGHNLENVLKFIKQNNPDMPDDDLDVLDVYFNYFSL
jgi:hypothetical protein